MDIEERFMRERLITMAIIRRDLLDYLIGTLQERPGMVAERVELANCLRKAINGHLTSKNTD